LVQHTIPTTFNSQKIILTKKFVSKFSCAAPNDERGGAKMKMMMTMRKVNAPLPKNVGRLISEYVDLLRTFSKIIIGIRL
jgi:hypothetical protein